jgi:hypothetical protein
MQAVLSSYLPTVLVQLVAEYYTTLQETTALPFTQWCALFDYIGAVLTYLAVREQYTYTLYKFYDYFLQAWPLFKKRISPNQYQLFGLAILYYVAPAPFLHNKRQLPVSDFTLYLLHGRNTLSEVVLMNDLLVENPIEQSNVGNLFRRITSALRNDACLDSPISIALFRSVFSTAPIRNYCHTEALLAWIISTAQRSNLKIRLVKEWYGMGASIKPRFCDMPLSIFYGVGPGLMARMSAQTIGEVKVNQLKPRHVPYQLWTSLRKVLS